MIYASDKFEVAMSNRLGEDTLTINMKEGRTDRQIDDGPTWFKFNISYLSGEKAGMMKNTCV